MSKSEPANISRKQMKFETKLEVERKIHNSYVSFDIVTFPIYGKNNGNMVVGEIPEFFQFPKCDICISTARCKCIIYIFTYKSIKVVIRPNLSTWLFYFPCGLFFMIFFLKLNSILFWGNTSYSKKCLYYNVRNWISFPTSWASVQRISIFDAI